VVSRGGRTDLAGHMLERVRASTLLIVGGDDEPVIELNRAALAQLCVEKELAIVLGATHLFAESGALEQPGADENQEIEQIGRVELPDACGANFRSLAWRLGERKQCG
jgi:hypothetical protein